MVKIYDREAFDHYVMWLGSFSRPRKTRGIDLSSEQNLTVQERMDMYKKMFKKNQGVTHAIVGSGLAEQAELFITRIDDSGLHYIYYRGSDDIKIANEEEMNEVLFHFLSLNSVMKTIQNMDKGYETDEE